MSVQLFYIKNTCTVPIMHLPSTGDDVLTAPCGELTCEELGAVSPYVTRSRRKTSGSRVNS